MSFCATSLADPDDDFSDLPARLHEAVCVDNVVERERAGDHWRKRSIRESVSHELSERGEMDIVRGISREVETANGEIAREHREGWHSRRLVAKRSVQNQQAAIGRGLYELREGRTADGIKHQRGAVPITKAGDLAHNVLLVGRDDCRRSLRAKLVRLRRSASERNRPGA